MYLSYFLTGKLMIAVDYFAKPPPPQPWTMTGPSNNLWCWILSLRLILHEPRDACNEKFEVLEDRMLKMRWTRFKCESSHWNQGNKQSAGDTGDWLSPPHLGDHNPGSYLALIRLWAARGLYNRAIEWYIQFWHWFGNPSTNSWDERVWSSFLVIPKLANGRCVEFTDRLKRFQPLVAF